LDEVDRKIVSQLQLDGRMTLKELSKIVGYTSMGVKKRVKNLLEQEAIKISALLNMELLNLSAAIVFLEIESSEAMHNILERFKYCPRVVHIFTTLGGYNLIAVIIAENKETLESISIEKCSLRSNRGIRRSEFYPISDVNYSPFLAIRQHLAQKQNTICACDVDCGSCRRYKAKKCVGCPMTHYYRGSL